MKALLKYLPICALLFAFANSGWADESKRGFYEGDLTGGGRIVFFAQGNHALSAYFFDVSGKQSGFAGGPVGDNGRFTLQTDRNLTITGTISNTTITATFQNFSITANRVEVFGNTAAISGRFSAPATSSSGTFDTKIVIDAQGRIFLVGKNGSTTIGGFGTIRITSNSASPTPTSGGTATPTPTASPSPSATPHDGDDDEDSDEDRNEDTNASSFTASFTVTLVTGETVTGQLTFTHGAISGTFVFNGVTYQINATKESAFNHLANISTRAVVGNGQGQLIGGFIITGGPKLVMIRANGPSLASAGVTDPLLANPKLQLFERNSNGTQVPLKENDDWQTNSNASDITASGLAPQNAKEAALLIRLEPGAYTTVVTGADGGTGIALVEVYELDRD